jgi:hypothetical protein
MIAPSEKVHSRLLLSDSQINSMAGAASGVFVSVLVSPLDVVRTRIQVKRLPKGMPDTPLLTVMYKLGRQEGFRAFYKGLGVTMLVRRIQGFHQRRLSLVSNFRVTSLIGQYILVLTNGRKSNMPLICHRYSTTMIC